MSLAFNEPKYEIDASDFRCHKCEGEVPCTSEYFSAVFHQEAAFLRRNFCSPCWKARDPADAFAFWRTRRPALATDLPRKARFDTVLVQDFFTRLGDVAAVQNGAPDGMEDLRFVLSLLLIRKKVLNLESSGLKDGSEWLKLSEKANPGRIHWVKNPELSDEQLERVKVKIGELLQMQI